jgi:hypothetical protein
LFTLPSAQSFGECITQNPGEEEDNRNAEE